MIQQPLRRKICGNYIALPTTFHADLSLNLKLLRQLVRRQIDAGYGVGNSVLLAAGAAGEFATLRIDERKQVVEAVMEEAAGQIPVVAGAQDTRVTVIQELARFAQQVGADAIQVSPPYYEPASPDDFLELVKNVSDAVDIPMVIYNTWWTGGGSSLDHEQVGRLLEVANVGALKWSAKNHVEYETVLCDFADKLPIIDNQLCEVWAHMLGGIGFTSHLPLVWPEYGIRLWENLQQQNYLAAMEMIRQLRVPYYELFHRAYVYSGTEGHFDKMLLGLVDMPAGPPRPPGRPLPESLREEARQMLLNAGVPGVRQAP
jgi:4-hydroxy-tetrahydrodipicolinate synthase